MRYLGVTAGIVLALCGVILIATGGSSKRTTPEPSSSRANATGAEVTSLFAGIPQHGNTLGNPKAQVGVQYFGDLQCPFCRRFTLGPLHSLIQSYVRGGRLKIEYRSLRTATQNPETFRIQQVAALAAGKQNKMWNFIELFYRRQGRENSGYVTESYLQRLAQQVAGLNLIAWTAARGDAELSGTLTSDAQTASEAGLASTPSFLLGKNGNTPYASAIKKLLLGQPATRGSGASVP